MNRYDSYKHSGIEWIGDVPGHWAVKRLKYVADAMPSNVDKKSKEDENAVVLCNYVDVYKNDFITANLPFMEATASVAQIEKFSLKKGDVIATKDSEDPNDIAVPALVVEDLDNVVCGYHLTLMRSFNVELTGEFLFWLLKSKEYGAHFCTEANGVTRFGIGTYSFKNVETVLPPPAEQTAIAHYLTRKTADLDHLIAQKTRLIGLYEAEKTAIINHAVTKGIDPAVKMKDSGVEWIGEVPEGWTVKRLKYWTKSIVGGGTPSTHNPKFWEGNIPWVSSKDMKVEEIVETQDYITEAAIEDSSTRLVPINSILIVVRSGILKHTLPVAINVVPVALNQDLKAIEPADGIGAKYFYFMLVGNANQILASCKKIGSTVDSLTMEDLLDFEMAVPTTIIDQQTIVAHIETETARLDRKISKTKTLIALLKEYRAVLISEVVTGKIKVAETG